MNSTSSHRPHKRHLRSCVSSGSGKNFLHLVTCFSNKLICNHGARLVLAAVLLGLSSQWPRSVEFDLVSELPKPEDRFISAITDQFATVRQNNASERPTDPLRVRQGESTLREPNESKTKWISRLVSQSSLEEQPEWAVKYGKDSGKDHRWIASRAGFQHTSRTA